MLLCGLAATPAAAADPSLSVEGRRCAYGTYTWITGDTCAKVYLKVYCNSSALFTKYTGRVCHDGRIRPGTVLCRPKVVDGKCS